MTRTNMGRFDAAMQDILNDVSRSVIGFDRVFDGFRSAVGTFDSYPPYNVEKMSKDEYRVIIALAGFDKKNIEVNKEGNWLTIVGKVTEPSANDPVTELLHQGLGLRAFSRKVQLADDIEVREATMKDGLLTIDLIRIIPEDKKAKSIKIK